MQIKYKRFDASLPKPEYQSTGAAAVDLVARIEVAIPAQEIGYIPLNIALKLPKNHWALLAARSSLHKKGLILANGIGIGDEDFSGDNDEYLAAVFNFSKKEVVVPRGERIAQLLVMPREKMELIEIENLDSQDRGGFGSTGDR